MIQQRFVMGFLVAGLLATSAGCATKRHVKAVIAPVEARVGDVEKRTGQSEADIDALEKQLSQTSEIAAGAEREAKNAKALATAADGKAVAAGEKAAGAQALAEKGMAKIGEVEVSFTNTIDKMNQNADNYQMIRTESIGFAFNRADLSKDMIAKLDTFAASIKGKSKYVVEIHGFTDKMGTAAYNQELSQKRALAVVRYLTVNHEIPLRRIQMIGAGAENPVADNTTKTGREQNRRVEIKVFALPETSKAQPALARSL